MNMYEKNNNTNKLINMGVRSGEETAPPPRKFFKVFCVKECILMHFLQRNIELLVSDTCASAAPGTKTVPLRDARNTNSGGD